MKKNNLTRLLIFGIIFMLFGCSEDLFDEQINNSKFKVNYVDSKGLKKNVELLKSLKKERLIDSNISGRIINDPINNFSIDTDFVKHLQGENFDSYTFNIIEKEENYLDNLVLMSQNDGSYMPYVMRYSFTEQDKQALITGSPIDFTNKGKVLLLNDYNIVNSALGRLMYQEECNMTSTWEEVVTISHDPNQCDCYGPDYVTYSHVLVGSMTCDGGGGGSELDDVATSPHGGGGNDTQTFPDTPCGRMQKKANETVFRQKFKDLNSNTYFKKDHENGYCEKRDANGNLTYQFVSAFGGTKSLTLLPGAISYMHVHMNDVQQDNGDGTVTTYLSVKMLSPADIFPLFGSLQSNAVAAGLTPLDTYGIMLSNEGIFSVNLIDSDFVLTGVIKAQIGYEYNIGVADVFKNTLPNTIERKEGLQKMLLTILKKNGLGDKVSLYEGETVIDLGDPLPKIHWVKKTLDASGNLLETPC